MKRQPYHCGQHVRATTISGEVDAHVITDDGGRKVHVGWTEMGAFRSLRVYEQTVIAGRVRAAA